MADFPDYDSEFLSGIPNGIAINPAAGNVTIHVATTTALQRDDVVVLAANTGASTAGIEVKTGTDVPTANAATGYSVDIPPDGAPFRVYEGRLANAALVLNPSTADFVIWGWNDLRQNQP